MLGNSDDLKGSGAIAVKTRSRAVALLLFLLIVSLGFIYPRIASTAASGTIEPLPQRRTQNRRPQRRGTTPRNGPQTARKDYSNFSHQTQAHQKACDSCHKFPSANWKEVRKGDAAFADITDYPQHASCIECHRQQFFTGAKPVICSTCHVNITPRNSVRFPFPSLGEPFYASKKAQNFTSDFRINFPHAKHVELVSQALPGSVEEAALRDMRASHAGSRAAQAEKSCSVCHETYQPQGKSDEEYLTKPPKDLGDKFWLKKGTFKTVPLTHAKCFECHSQDSGLAPAPTDCNTCHKLATGLPAQPAPDFNPSLTKTMGITDPLVFMKWRRRDSSGAFRHEGGAHPDMSCTACHKVETMDTLDPRTQKVSLASCSDCHVTATSDDGGALNLEIDQRKANPGFQCVKCHIAYGQAPIPVSHTGAIPVPKSK
jgi:hypothetical protein